MKSAAIIPYVGALLLAGTDPSSATGPSVPVARPAATPVLVASHSTAPTPPSPQTQQTLSDLWKTVTRSTVLIQVTMAGPGPPSSSPGPIQTLASGVFVADRLVLTCEHVVRHAGTVASRLMVAIDADWTAEGAPPGGRVATVVSPPSGKLDLALLYVAGATAPAVGPSRDPIEIGDEAFYIGHPDARLSFQHPEPVLATALISAKEVADKGGRRLRLQASLTHGFSGGGLFSRRTGLLIGIVDARMGPGLSPEEEAYVNGAVDRVEVERPVLQHLLEESDRGVAYAIGLDDVRPFVGDVLAHLSGARPGP